MDLSTRESEVTRVSQECHQSSCFLVCFLLQRCYNHRKANLKRAPVSVPRKEVINTAASPAREGMGRVLAGDGVNRLAEVTGDASHVT